MATLVKESYTLKNYLSVELEGAVSILSVSPVAYNINFTNIAQQIIHIFDNSKNWDFRFFLSKITKPNLSFFITSITESDARSAIFVLKNSP